MKIDKVKITNFKCYGETFTLVLNDGLNVIVGRNESGKTTILEAIHLALTGLLLGRPLKSDLTSYLFNLTAQQKYVVVREKGLLRSDGVGRDGGDGVSR